MSTVSLQARAPAHADPRTLYRPPSGRAGSLYRALLAEQGDEPGRPDRFTLAAARNFLHDRLATVAGEAGPALPRDVARLHDWLHGETARVKSEWRAYLAERKEGAPRRYFRTRSHALHTLRAIAPTKRVDGAWLYGLLPHWRDQRLNGLIRTYLEELGNGSPAHNHVAIYERLLAGNGCETVDGLPDDSYTQGAIQLALGHDAATFGPEAIGFNLGYEQLPLHLLVMAHELRELGFDPTYFSLHVTIDNDATGHARRAVDAVVSNRSRLGNEALFHQRLTAGYALNSLGRGTTDAIASFDIDRELVAVLSRKAVHGAELHSDRCRIAGRTINEWLSDPTRMPDFLEALQEGHWLRRGSDPRSSRFMRLFEGDRAPMSGVFDGYEQQLIEDWVRGGDAVPRPPSRPAPEAPMPQALESGGSVADIVGRHIDAAGLAATGDFEAETRALRDRLADAGSDAETMTTLIGWMSPARHATPAGLLATRIYDDLLPRVT